MTEILRENANAIPISKFPPFECGSNENLILPLTVGIGFTILGIRLLRIEFQILVFNSCHPNTALAIWTIAFQKKRKTHALVAFKEKEKLVLLYTLSCFQCSILSG